MGRVKDLMLEMHPIAEEEDDFDSFFAEMQADDWSRIIGLGLPLPGPEDFRPPKKRR